MFDLVKNDADCYEKMEKIHKELFKVPAADRILDFNQIKRFIKLPTGKVIKGEEAIRASQLRQKLKNVVMQLLLKNRETRKVPKLKDILN